MVPSIIIHESVVLHLHYITPIYFYRAFFWKFVYIKCAKHDFKWKEQDLYFGSWIFSPHYIGHPAIAGQALDTWKLGCKASWQIVKPYQIVEISAMPHKSSSAKKTVAKSWSTCSQSEFGLLWISSIAKELTQAFFGSQKIQRALFLQRKKLQSQMTMTSRATQFLVQFAQFILFCLLGIQIFGSNPKRPSQGSLACEWNELLWSSSFLE